MYNFTGEKNDDPQSPSYVPSIFGANDNQKYEQQQRRYESLERRRHIKEQAEAASALLQLNTGEEHTVPKEQDGLVPAEELIALQKEYKSKITELNCLQEDYRSRVEEQTLQNGKKFPSGRGFPDETALKEDDKLTAFYTGLPSFGIFMSLLNFVTKKTPENPSYKLTHLQSFLLTLMKLRLNLSNYDLGFRFCVHETTVSRILSRWLQLMDIRLSPLIRWPEREELQKTMPWCFRSHYDLRVTSIIDCFELFIEKPTALMARSATWSTYKHHNTVKYLISITPQGTVSFLSKGYGGRVSDKHITEDCGYLYKLQQGDVVLADRGFNVQKSVAFRGATLNIPAFTKGKSQLPAADVEETCKLANVRIHVERVIGAVRQRFQILNATTPLPTEYTKSKLHGPVLLDSIVRCCALHNACDVIVPTE